MVTLLEGRHFQFFFTKKLDSSSFKYFWRAQLGLIFLLICGASAVHVQSVYVGLTQQVHIGRGTT